MALCSSKHICSLEAKLLLSLSGFMVASIYQSFLGYFQDAMKAFTCWSLGDSFSDN